MEHRHPDRRLVAPLPPTAAAPAPSRVEIKNTPATIKGTLGLAPVDAGTQVDVDIECKVGIPMVGGKIEGLIMTDLEKTAEAEKQFGADWLAKKQG